MCCKLLRVDCPRPGEEFGNEFTDYLVGLPWTSLGTGNGIMDEMWCRPGRTGTIALLVGLYWQALYSGAGKKWASNLERVETIFRAILNAPALYVFLSLYSLCDITHWSSQRAKRGRADSVGLQSDSKKRHIRK